MAVKIACLLLSSVFPTVVQAQFTFTTNNGTIAVTGYTGSDGAVVIPSAINGYRVTSIGDEAFYESTNVISLTITDSVTNIGRAALAFSTVTNVILGNGVSFVGDLAFEGCGMSHVTLPGSTTSLGYGVFWGCPFLTSVTIPNAVTSIGDETFIQCSSLTNVTIGAGVTNIGQSAFEQCVSLTSVIIPRSVIYMGTYAFAFCGLTNLYFQGNGPELGYEALYEDLNVTVYFLPGTTGWEAFSGLNEKYWLLPYPEILSFEPGFGVETNGFSFLISWATNASVVVESSTNLADSVWSPIRTNTLDSGTAYFTDPQWTNYPNRFYRIRSP